MKVTIVFLILGFCHSECYANPNRCICAPNPGVSSLIQTGLRPYDHELVQERLEDPEILASETRQTSSKRATTGSGNIAGPRYRKSQLNFQKSKQSEYDLGEYSETGNRLKQEKILKKPENSGQNLFTGIYNLTPPREGRSFFRPDIQLQREYVREPDLSADAAYGDYEYVL